MLVYSRNETRLIAVATSLALLAALSACTRAASPKATSVASQSPTAALTPAPEPTPTPTLSGIRAIDFENFTYPGWPIFRDRRKRFTLRNGELPVPRDKAGHPTDVGLAGSATYFDVTGDGVEDAIVGFSEDNSGGTAIVYAAYIYTLRNGQPVFLWGFEAGDRADGGLRSIYGQNGELVVELEGKNKVIGKNLYGGDDTSHGACCPTFFTRTRYRWNGRRFIPTGAPENLPLDGAPMVDPFPERVPYN